MSSAVDVSPNVSKVSCGLDKSPESVLGVAEYFGRDVFDRRQLAKSLSPVEFANFNNALSQHKPIDFATADAIATALLRWATERGATHYTHWFQPITGTTAEKHDTFIDTLRDGETPLVRFTGKQLIMGEPDGSSFPSGGLRATHVARGYTAWDPHSPPFVLKNGNGATLYIPSCFFSWDNNLALDEKIPLLRSEAALARESLRLFQVLGQPQHKSVHMDAGLEQEFFLIDREYFLRRPDLVAAGRTVFGAAPPKGQELEDQYFGHISKRFLDCIHDFEIQAWLLGIPIQTRHREVAPGQYEVAPKFAPANIGTDRNLIMMELLRKTARKHGLAALLHEKPFKGVNGSGKHNNWSLGSNEVPSLLTPGDVPDKNPQFLLFLAATIRAVSLHGDLMRVAISGAGNDHRLGANEAPPAIVSAYLGDDIEEAVNRFIGESKVPQNNNNNVDLGIRTLPQLSRAPTDRNRTSTFAFTGNKFEFRAVGSSHNPSRSNCVLNTIVADSIRYIADEVAALLKGGAKVDDALATVTKKVLKEHKRAIFNGNGYSEDWQKEAAKRGLPNLKTTPDALDTYVSPKNIQLFESLNVLSKVELEARSAILYEEYAKKIGIEGKLTYQIAQRDILPAAIAYQTKVAQSISAVEAVKVNATAQRNLLEKLSKWINQLTTGVEQVQTALNKVHDASTPAAVARSSLDNVVPASLTVREAVDNLEALVPANEWPLPTYHQMLFHQE